MVAIAKAVLWGSGAFLLFLSPSGGARAADLVASPPAPAPYFAANDFWGRQHLFGDWGGLRSGLQNLGVDVSLTGADEAVGNLSGGRRQTVQEAGQVALQAKFDLQKIAGLQDASFSLRLVDRWGRDLDADAGIPTLQEVEEIAGRGNIVRLENFAYDQKLFGNLIDIKVGRLAIGDDFFFSSCDFINLTFCGGQPGNILGNYIYNWPISQWGGVGRVNAGTQGYFQVGVYDSNPNYLTTKPDIALLPGVPSGSQGTLIPVELGWTPKFGGLAGLYKIGGWYDSASAPNAATSLNGQPILISGLPGLPGRGRSGVYLSFQQQLTHDPASSDSKNGLLTFVNASYGDHRTSVEDYQIVWGFKQHGVGSTRPEDEIGVAVGTTHINAAIASAEAAANNLGIGPGYVQRNEYAMEAWYGWQAAGWLNLKFDAQYVVDPGGYASSTNRNAVVLGVRTSVDF